MNNTVVHIVVRVTIPETNKEITLSYFQELVLLSKQEDGNIYYDFFQDIDDNWIIIELWKSREAVVFHNNSEHFKTLIPKINENATFQYIKSGVDTIGDLPIPSFPANPIILLVVTVNILEADDFKVNENKFKELATELALTSRKESGCYLYTFIKVDGSNDEYLFIELWENDAVISVHSNSAHASELIPKLDQVSSVKSILKATFKHEN